MAGTTDSDNEDVKPNVDDFDPNAVISVKLTLSDGNEPIQIRAKKKTTVAKVLEAFAKQKGIDATTLKLFLDGVRIQPTRTLGEAGVDDEDQLDVSMEQVGGAF
eukprot:TRINITY_DN2432_c0_g1_i1.p2 TRINITY_DN2432_c0_g1~~TRINITY_DN2432_c0_g1_i1.p2  ORF type:complete len:113 (+),score=41.28 TRINITY_DN2432_c0_g1_i1:28-339(+)